MWVFCFVLNQSSFNIKLNLHEKAITETASRQIIFEDAVLFHGIKKGEDFLLLFNFGQKSNGLFQATELLDVERILCI